MRWVALLALLAGCPFSHGNAYERGGDGGGSGSGSGSGSGMRDASLDGPPDTFVAVGPPVVDTMQSTSAGNVASLSWTHTASGSHRLVVVGLSWGLGGATVTSATYGGVAMTEIGTRNNTTKNIRASLYMLVAPPTGAQVVVVTFSGGVGDHAFGGSVSFTGVDQTTPVGPFASSVGGGPAIATTLASGSNEVVIDAVASDSNPSGLNIGAGQTSMWTIHSSLWGAASVKPGATSVTMSWTETGSSDDWAQCAVSIKGG